MRVAYVCHVDSRWIKQRPQFLAEALNDLGLRVTYYCPLFVRRASLVARQQLHVHVRRLPVVPQRLRRRLPVVDTVMAVLSAILIVLTARPDAAIITHGRYWRVARTLRGLGVTVYYDCMDINEHFTEASHDDGLRESDLIRDSTHVFCSSEAIARHIRRKSSGARTTIVRNALAPEALAAPRREIAQNSVVYVGTISEWLDFVSIIALLESAPEVTISLVGPSDVDVPEHDRLLTLGATSHPEAIAIMSSADVLVLPFKITPLIEGVDPVKLYEYIACGRPVVATRYAELEHFGSLIERYSGSEEFVRRVLSCLGKESLRNEQLQSFIDENSWKSRASVIRGELQC